MTIVFILKLSIFYHQLIVFYLKLIILILQNLIQAHIRGFTGNLSDYCIILELTLDELIY